MPAYLGEFEQLVLVAIVRLGDDSFGGAIRDVVADASGRRVWIGAVHTTLDRLEAKGLVRSQIVDTPGDRRRKLYRLQPAGKAAVARAHETWTRLTHGLKTKLDAL